MDTSQAVTATSRIHNLINQVADLSLIQAIRTVQATNKYLVFTSLNAHQTTMRSSTYVTATSSIKNQYKEHCTFYRCTLKAEAYAF